MERYYYISGYWKDTNENFEEYIVKETDYEEDQDLNDEDVFYYELPEEEIKKAIDLKWNTELEFVITEYKEYEN